MKKRVSAVALALGTLSCLPALAQRRAVGSTLLLPEVQAEYALRNDDYLLFSLQGPIRTGGYEGTQLDRVGVQVAYERFWNTQWSGGATARADAYTAFQGGGDNKYLYFNLTPGLFVRHWNTIGTFNFRQRLAAEYSIPTEPLTKGRAVGRLRLDADRVFAVGKVALRPRLAYEALAYLRFQREETEAKERVIDFGNLRADLGIILSPHFDVTPWVGASSTYSFVLGFTDVDGNVVIPAGRYNAVTPVVGLDVRYTIFRGKAAFERRQLPTQH